MRSLQYALRRTLPILLGFFPIGVTYGILMESIGYSFLWSGLCSAVVLAGSLQFLMVSFFSGGASLVTIIVMSLLLNSRHIFYGLSFIEQFNSYGPWKPFMIYGLVDEGYSLLCSYKHIEGVNDKWVNILSTGCIWLFWTAFSMLGGLIGSLITFDTTGFDFALTAIFITISLDQLREADSPLPALIAAASGVVCLALIGPGSFILPSLIATTAALMLLRPVLEKKEEKEAR